MAVRYEYYHRLESAPPFENLDRGLRAEIYDPAWLLGKQWQLGEHQGEDASSPVAVSYRVSHRPIDPLDGDRRMDPRIIPPEAIVESEPDDWWTPGRRIRLGIAAGASLPPLRSADPALLLSDLPTPYERFNGRGYDGQKLYGQRVALGLDHLNPDPFAEVPAEPRDLWDPVELVYATEFACAGRRLALERHSGGQIDWYSVDADAPLPTPSPLPAPTDVYPNRLRYPGAPNPRWWQIEDAKLDIGGFPPDRSHFATMLLIDLIVSHSDDWFLFPIVAPTGHVVTFHDVRVRDAFGDIWTVTPPGDWSLFAVTGLDTTSLLIWPTVTTPLSGPTLEDVVLGVDEDANVLWAVEQRINGRDIPTSPSPDALKPDGDGRPVLATERKHYGYRPSTPMFPYWHPYQIAEVGGKRRLIQGRLANLAVDPPELMPAPRARVLSDPAAVPPAPAHQIEPATIPTLGLRLERRAMLARGTDGRPVLWTQRRRLPLLSPPAPRLRFDLLQEETAAVP
jgi:hypothetical protein